MKKNHNALCAEFGEDEARLALLAFAEARSQWGNSFAMLGYTMQTNAVDAAVLHLLRMQSEELAERVTIDKWQRVSDAARRRLDFLQDGRNF